MNIRQKNKRIKMQNKKLTERYPFLIPRNCFSGKVMKGYNHSYTELDCLEPGWKKAFGILICEDIRNELIKHNYLYKYRIMEIKEKYGSLRWYDNGAPGNVHDMIMKYEYNPSLAKFLKLEISTIISTFNKTNTKNLRVLKHALNDFERIYTIEKREYS